MLLSYKTNCFAHDNTGELCRGELRRFTPPAHKVGNSSYLIATYRCSTCASEKHVCLTSGACYYHNNLKGTNWNLGD